MKYSEPGLPGHGELRLVLDHIIFQGQSYRLESTSYDRFGAPHGKTVEQVQIPRGTELSFQLSLPVIITSVAQGIVP